MSNADELSCMELVELVTDYLEGTLPPEERARFETHLAGCDGCQNYIEQMRQTILVAGMVTEEAISPEAEAELLQVFRSWKSGRTN